MLQEDGHMKNTVALLSGTFRCLYLMYSKVAWVLASPDRIFDRVVECRNFFNYFTEKRLHYGEFPSNFKYSRNTRKKHFHFQYSYKWYTARTA